MSSGKAALVIGLLIGSPDRSEHHHVFVVFFSYLFALSVVLSAYICLLDSPFRGYDEEITKSLTLILGLRYY